MSPARPALAPVLAGAIVALSTRDARAQTAPAVPGATPVASSPSAARPSPTSALPPSPAADPLALARERPRAPAARALTLDEALRVALAQQPQILAARAESAIANADVEVARAPFLPQITGIAQYGYGTLHTSPIASTGGTTATPTATSNSPQSLISFGATANQLLYDFGQTSGRYSAAKKTFEADRLSEVTIRVDVELGVRRAYFTARANRELVDVARETLEDQQTHLQQVQGFVAVGTQPQIALAQQKAAVANAQVQLITAQNNYDTAKAQLNQAAGIPGDTEYDVVDEGVPELPDEEQPLATLVNRALLARPEIASLVKQREAQEESIASARGGYAPTLSATATVSESGLTSGSRSTQQLNWGFLWGVGVLASWPLFQGGLTQGQVRAAEGTLQNLDAQQSLEALQVRLDVNSAQLAVHAAKATIGAAEDAVTNAQDQLRLAEQRYATGVGSIIELNDAQVAYTTAAAQLVQARYQLASARAQFLAAMGRT